MSVCLYVGRRPRSTKLQTNTELPLSLYLVKQENDSSLGGGAVAGIVIGVLIFIILCIVAAAYVRKHLSTEKAPEAMATFNNPVNFNSDTPL